MKYVSWGSPIREGLAEWAVRTTLHQSRCSDSSSTELHLPAVVDVLRMGQDERGSRHRVVRHLTGPLAIALLVLLLRRRRGLPRQVIVVNLLQVLCFLPSDPSLKPLEYVFPGRKTPPDAEPNVATTASGNPHRDPEPPGGLRRRESWPITESSPNA